MSVKKNIRKAHQALGYTQESVGHMLGISQQAYQQIEEGPTRVDADLLRSLATVLETTTDFLLYGVEKKLGPPRAAAGALDLNEKEILLKLLEANNKIIELQEKILGEKERKKKPKPAQKPKTKKAAQGKFRAGRR
jgi:transcriptional regulator with XRE-family HTH domain